jgi:two-component sensor histidine kinase
MINVARVSNGKLLERIANEVGHLWREGFPPRSLSSYLFAVVCIASASLLRYALNWVDDGRLPFATYYPAILLVTLLGGIGPGGFATILSLILMWLDSVPNVGLPTRNQAIYIFVHAVASAVTLWLAEGYRRVVRRLREEEKQRMLLMGELQHRGRNILAVVQAIVHLTLRESREDADKINNAIGALLAADELLTRSTALTAGLRDILAAELRPYDVTRIVVLGESVMLAPNLARAFALITHELATNAAKYGALSQPQGRLSVSWTIAGRRIQVRWVEENGPVVAPPVRRGFGSHLFERLLSGFDGSVGTDFRTCGLVCEISFSLPV